MSKQNYVGIKSVHCTKCGRDYTPIVYSDECPHNKIGVSEQDELLTQDEIDALWLKDSRNWGLRVAEAQLAEDKQRIKELEGELEREKFHHQFAEDVIEDMKKEK